MSHADQAKPKPATPTPAPPPPGGHTEHEDQPWTVNIPNHPPRADSPEYVKSRTRMNTIAAGVANFYYGAQPYQDHHGGGLWLKDANGWFIVRNMAGIEWSAQFCADPRKVDQLRLNARRLYAGFPGVAEELGIRTLLDTPITDAAGIANWTDSICNASVALSPTMHTGVLPNGGGVHHYPAPIVEIESFKHDDFKLWVTDAQGQPAAVVPVGPRGSGDGRVQVVYSTPNTELNKQQSAAGARGEALILPPEHSLAQEAFFLQYSSTAALKR
jgi:hypothetical protein